MDIKQRGSRWVLIAGILIALLGLIHIAATPYIYPSFAMQLAAGHEFVFLYMFIATGIAVIFIGLLIMYCSRGLKTNEPWARTIALAAGLFMLILGICAVLAMAGNPFAYLTVVFSIVELLPLWLYRRELRQKGK